MNVGYCRSNAILVRSLPRFLVLSHPLSFPSTVLPLSSTFDPRIYSCPTFPPARAPSHTSSNKNASCRTERAALPRRCALPYAHPAHSITNPHSRSPPPMSLPARRARVLRNATPPLEARARRVPPTYDPRPQVHLQRLHWRSLVLGARSFIGSPGPASILAPVPLSLLDLCTWAIPPRPLLPPVSVAHADSFPLARLRPFYLSRHRRPHGTRPQYNDTRWLQRPRHPFLVAHPAAVATGGHPSSQGTDARMLEDAAQLSHRTPRCPQDTSALHCACALSRSAPQLGPPCADAHPHAGEKEYGKGTA
ncbi:hypothetical protein B0H13DRAFT_2665749 [Mycena leptocephala]|nr:hypothetical protein B0H13DRAFT_2665749 [Mycena leptocephala]